MTPSSPLRRLSKSYLLGRVQSLHVSVDKFEQYNFDAKKRALDPFGGHYEKMRWLWFVWLANGGKDLFGCLKQLRISALDVIHTPTIRHHSSSIWLSIAICALPSQSTPRTSRNDLQIWNSL